jgi:hypothetical protein
MLFAATSALAQPQDFFANGGRAPDTDLPRLIREADRHPLGSRENPVRAAMPAGQHAYLRRLRCSDGRAPAFNRVGNFAPGVFGSIIDGYDVRCEGGEPVRSLIFMDMYFPGYEEARPVPGFTIAPGADALPQNGHPA